MLIILATAGLTLYVAAAAALYVAQRHILFAPDPARPILANAQIPALQELTLTTTDNLHLLAWYLPPKPGQPVLAYFHGNGGNLENRIARLRHFATLGWGVLIPEYRGYGGNPGHPSEAGFANDAEAAMAYLATQPPAPIVLYGESIGTGVAARAATQHQVAALILESPYTSITAIAAAQYPIFPVRLLLRDPFDTLSRINRVQAPILILQGAKDTIVPPALGQALYRAAPNPKQIWTAPNGGHEDLMQHGAMPVIERFVAGL